MALSPNPCSILRSSSEGIPCQAPTARFRPGERRPPNIGLDILLAGGNTFDAAAATILALNQTDYSNVHFGGEVPIIFYQGTTGQVKVMSGQGPAPALATLAYFQGSGGIPGTGGGIRNAAVPGLVLAVMTMVKD